MRICRRIDYPVEQVLLDSVPVTGHAFAADAFINHGAAVERDLFRPGMPYVVAAASLGATFSAWCFTIEQELNKSEQGRSRKALTQGTNLPGFPRIQPNGERHVVDHVLVSFDGTGSGIDPRSTDPVARRAS